MLNDTHKKQFICQIFTMLCLICEYSIQFNSIPDYFLCFCFAYFVSDIYIPNQASLDVTNSTISSVMHMEPLFYIVCWALSHHYQIRLRFSLNIIDETIKKEKKIEADCVKPVST